jgi:hypothetical protein
MPLVCQGAYMRDRWANSIRALRRVSVASISLPTPVPAGLESLENVFEPFAGYVDAMRGLEALPIDTTEFFVLKLRLTHSLRYFLRQECGAAAFELRLCIRRVRSLSWSYAC